MSGLGVSALTTSAIGAVKTLTARKAYIQDFATQHTLIQVDASIREMHAIEAPPTEFPIENGQTISDNFVIKPFVLDMDGIISDSPVSLGTTAVTSALSTVLPASGVIAGAAAVGLFNVLADTTSPSVANFNQFVSIVVNKRTVNIYTTLNKYMSMWLSSLRVERTAQMGAALSFHAHFVQVILVQPQVVNVAKYSNPAVSSAQANLGQAQGSALSKAPVTGFNNGFILGKTTTTQ